MGKIALRICTLEKFIEIMNSWYCFIEDVHQHFVIICKDETCLANIKNSDKDNICENIFKQCDFLFGRCDFNHDEIWKRKDIMPLSREIRKIKKRLKKNIIEDGSCKEMISFAYDQLSQTLNYLSGIRNCTNVAVIDNAFEIKSTIRMKRIINKSDRIICGSRDVRNRISKYYPGVQADIAEMDIQRAINGIRSKASDENIEISEIFSSFLNENCSIIAVHADCNDNHLSEQIIKAFSIICSLKSNIRMFLTGEGDWSRCQMLAEQLGIEDKIYLAGELDNPYVYMKNCSINVLASIRERLPIQIIEGWALGINNAVTNCPSGPAEMMLTDCDTYSVGMSFFELIKDSIDREAYGTDDGVVMIEGDGINRKKYAGTSGRDVLLPAMSREYLDDPLHITTDVKNMAYSLLRILTDDFEKYYFEGN